MSKDERYFDSFMLARLSQSKRLAILCEGEAVGHKIRQSEDIIVEQACCFIEHIGVVT